MTLSLPFGPDKKCCGSLTLEAALVLPLVIFLMTAFMILIIGMGLNIKLQEAIDRVNQRISVLGYIEKKAAESASSDSSGTSDTSTGQAGSGSDSTVSYFAGNALLQGVIYAEVLEEMEGALGTDKLIAAGENDFAFSAYQYHDPERVYIGAYFAVKLLFLPQKMFYGLYSSSSTRRLWTGDPIKTGSSEKVVYITENGTVYHTHLDCTYLKLSIQEGEVSKIEAKRNSSGEKYTACEICGKDGGSTVYYTTYGEKYHYNRNCIGLKRTIRSVPFSQKGNLPECSKCRARDQAGKNS